MSTCPLCHRPTFGDVWEGLCMVCHFAMCDTMEKD